MSENSEKKRKNTENKEKSAEEKYNKIISDSHSVAKETLERYRLLEEEFSNYKENNERKISKLRKENRQMAN